MPEMTLNKDSSDRAIADWIGRCIADNIREGLEEKHAQGKCYGMATDATGKEIRRGK